MLCPYERRHRNAYLKLEDTEIEKTDVVKSATIWMTSEIL
jgi:hypothetical protein